MTHLTTMITSWRCCSSAAKCCAASPWRSTIGVLVGTYSSIYIASAIALDLKLTARDLMPVHEGERHRGRDALMARSIE